MLLTAVLASIVSSMHTYAGSGWESNNQYLYLGDTGTSQGALNQTLLVGLAYDDQTGRTTVDTLTTPNNTTTVYIRADLAATNATIANATFNDGTSIDVQQNSWGTGNKFDVLTFEQLNVTNSGSISFTVSKDTHNVAIEALSGTLKRVSNAGTLTIGTADSTTTLNGLITNSGTLTINGAISFKIDANSGFETVGGGEVTYSYNSENEEGFKSVAGAQYELIGENSGTINITAEQEGMTITKDETTGNVTSVVFSAAGYTGDTFRINGSNIDEAALIADTASTGVTATTKYELVAGTLTVAGDISTDRLSYSGGTLALGSNTLTIADGNAQLLLNTTGAGNVTLTANLALAREQATQATGKLTISNGAQLNLGNGDLWNGTTAGTGASISSFTAVELDNGTIRIQNPDATINNLTVTTNGGVIDANDLANDTSKYKINLIGNTTLNGNLTYKNQWNTYTEVENLTGSGNLIIDGANRSDQNTSTFSILGATDYKGEVQMTDKANNMTLSVAQDLGVNVRVSTRSGEMNLNGIAVGNQIILQGASGSMTAGSTVVADVKIENSANGQYAGMEIATAADNATMKYTGTVTGGGNYIVLPSKTVTVDGTNQKVSVSTTTEFAGDTSGWTGKMEVVNGTQNVIYSGSEIINNSEIKTRSGADDVTIDDPVMNLTIKHDTAAVTVNSAISGTVNMTVNATEGATFTKSVTATTTTLAADTTATFNGTSNLGSLTLGDGASIAGAGNLTIGELILDLQSYTSDFGQSHTLVSTTGTLSFTGDLSQFQNVTVGDYTANVEQNGNAITLSFSAPDAPDTSITTTVLSQGGIADGMLTLNVDGNLTDAAQVFITGISDSVMAEILGLNGLPENGMVGITLQGAEGGTFTATADQMIGFQGKDGGIYFGENVGDAWQYQVAYIPEPASATLGLAALMMLAARRRRKA